MTEQKTQQKNRLSCLAAIPGFKQVRCCIFALFLLSFFAILLYKTAPTLWKSFYSMDVINTKLPTIGSAIELPECKVTINRVEKIPSTSNANSDFQTLVVDMTIESKLPVKKFLLEIFNIWIEDKFGNKFEFSPAERRNDTAKESEVLPSGALNLTAYFSVPKYSSEFYLMVQPKIGGKAVKVKL
ncbi:MAG: hypothetical protein WCP97_02140 [bacterium]